MNLQARGTPGEGTGPTNWRPGPLTRRFGFKCAQRDTFQRILQPALASILLEEKEWLRLRRTVCLGVHLWLPGYVIPA